MQNKLLMFLIGAIILLVAAFSFTLGRQTALLPIPESKPAPAPTSTALGAAIPLAVQPRPTLSPLPSHSSPAVDAEEPVPIKGAKVFREKFGEVELTFLPTSNFRKMIEYRNKPTVDSSCSKVSAARETVRGINYAWDFVIESFTTWSEGEGKQEYMVNENDLPNAFQGSLRDIVKEGRVVTIEKQLCGQGQVEGLVAVRP